MPRTRKQRTLDEIRSDIAEATGKLDELQKEERRVLDAENISVGKIVRQIFGKTIPGTVAERKAFFQELYELYERSQLVVSDGDASDETDGMKEHYETDAIA